MALTFSTPLPSGRAGTALATATMRKSGTAKRQEAEQQRIADKLLTP